MAARRKSKPQPAKSEPAPVVPAPEAPRHLTTGQLYQLHHAARAVVLSLSKVKRKDWTAGERHLHKRCQELLAMIVQPNGAPVK